MSIEYAYYCPPDETPIFAPQPEPVVTLLDNNGTTVEIDHRDAESQIYRHRDTIFQRGNILKSLEDIKTTPKGKVRFRRCGLRAAVQYCPELCSYRVASMNCGHRWCPACRKRSAALLRNSLNSLICPLKKHDLKFITLTIRGNLDPLRTQVKFLWKSFRRLRQSLVWKRRIRWGIAVIEVTYNKTTNLWHPHLHCIAAGGFIHRRALSNAWKKASLGSVVSDIREVKKASKAVNYVLKYATKGGDSLESDRNFDLLPELINGIYGLRTVQWFGNKPSSDQLQEEADKEKRKCWIDVGWLSQVISMKRRGNAAALAILNALDDTATKHPFYSLFEKPLPP